jgi:shikimate kinase
VEGRVDYYGHHPVVALERPVALIGFSGAGVHKAGWFLASLTGLPFSDLDRKIEHAASRSLGQVQVEEGEQAWRRLERQLLRQELGATPPRLLCLGEGALLDPALQEQVLAQATVVYVRRPRERLLQGIHEGLREAPSRYPMFLGRFPLTAAALEPLLMLREPGYERAQLMVDAGSLGAVETAQLIARRLGWAV